MIAWVSGNLYKSTYKNILDLLLLQNSDHKLKIFYINLINEINKRLTRKKIRQRSSPTNTNRDFKDQNNLS